MSWKHTIWRFLGKDPQAVVVSFLSGPETLARAMLKEVRSLVPDREHYAVTNLKIDDTTCISPRDFPGPLREKRIGLAPTLFTGHPDWTHLQRLAVTSAPGKILAYNARLERHHLRLRSAVASILFLRGVPLDRIWLRPKWFPFRRERTIAPATHQIFEGRPLREGKPRIAVLTPYFPFPLSHGGAVRIYNLLREGAGDFDIFLFAFMEKSASIPGSPVLDFCSKVIVFAHPRYREPRWASLNPPEVNEFYSKYVESVIRKVRAQYALKVLQVEYTQMASYLGEILVEHDVTFDLSQQVAKVNNTLSARWDLIRWRRYEQLAVQSAVRVVVMSEKDRELLGNAPNLRVIPNGVDLKRFQPEPEEARDRILFVGSFRHFPNVVAFRWFVEQVWPLVKRKIPGARFVTIAGPSPELYFLHDASNPEIEVHGFVSDVRSFYAATNVVVVPTQVSAGTNLKVLEALACERAVVSTTSGCAGLGLRHGSDVWIADDPEAFADAIEQLLQNSAMRSNLAENGRAAVERSYGWRRIARLQTSLWNELLTGIIIRPGRREDIPEIHRIQLSTHTASQWEPESYFDFRVTIAERNGQIAGFIVTRDVYGENEVLNLATAPEFRRQGVGKALLGSIDGSEVFLEVRESNEPARKLYENLGFTVVGVRSEYYDNPVENALVMRLSRRASS